MSPLMCLEVVLDELKITASHVALFFSIIFRAFISSSPLFVRSTSHWSRVVDYHNLKTHDAAQPWKDKDEKKMKSVLLVSQFIIKQNIGQIRAM